MDRNPFDKRDGAFGRHFLWMFAQVFTFCFFLTGKYKKVNQKSNYSNEDNTEKYHRWSFEKLVQK